MIPSPPTAAAGSLDPSPLDRESPLPLWAQLYDRLRLAVASGGLDDRFPTEAELTALYDVSRHTVREAMRHLQQEGVVTRRRGKGTFVRKARYQQGLGALYSLFRSIEAQGVVQRSEVLDKGTVTNAEVAQRLGLAGAEDLVFIERLRLADEEPLALDQAWLPASVAAPLLEADLTRTALYDELAARCGVVPDGGREEIRPVVLDPEICTRFNVEPGHAVFSIDRLTRAGDRPIEWRHTLLRGDRFGFVAEWSAGHDGRADVAVHPV